MSNEVGSGRGKTRRDERGVDGNRTRPAAQAPCGVSCDLLVNIDGDVLACYATDREEDATGLSLDDGFVVRLRFAGGWEPAVGVVPDALRPDVGRARNVLLVRMRGGEPASARMFPIGRVG